jgi:ectoine hydroxylase-related dioxygenase (phytanoyl-CoA dioxygenase family)
MAVDATELQNKNTTIDIIVMTKNNSNWTAQNAVILAAATAVGAYAWYSSYRRRFQEQQHHSWKRPLTRVSANQEATPEQVVAALRRDGAVIVEGLLSTETVDQVKNDVLALAHLEYSGSADSFAGEHTRRCGPYILSHSAAARQLAAHPLHVAVSRLLLGKLARRIRLSTVACIRCFAGQKAQILHRDDEEWPISLLGRIHEGLEIQCSAMYAITDFRASNGATNVVVGSHGQHDNEDDGEAPPLLRHCQQAVMPRGSVLFFTGSIWHGTGAASESDETTGRMGFLVQHIAGYLHPEYNLHFAIPPHQSQYFDDPTLCSLLGFDGPTLFPQANLPGPVYATEYTGYPDRTDADFSQNLSS